MDTVYVESLHVLRRRTTAERDHPNGHTYIRIHRESDVYFCDKFCMCVRDGVGIHNSGGWKNYNFTFELKGDNCNSNLSLRSGVGRRAQQVDPTR